MYTNYFFIPTSKYKYIKKSEKIENIDNRIFDFEDSILDSEIVNSINLLSNVIKRDNDWIRLTIVNYELFKNLFTKCLGMGYKNFIIPKFSGVDDLSSYIDPILGLNKKAKFILLIENANALTELEIILRKYKFCIQSIGLGIHDFYSDMGMMHDESILKYLRVNLIILAKAYNIEPIDIVSMNISNIDSLKEEIFDGFKCGYRAKFLIHPFQVEVLKSFKFYTYDEVLHCKTILDYYNAEVKGKNAAFSYEGKVYEKMHLKDIGKIIDWGKIYYGIR